MTVSTEVEGQMPEQEPQEDRMPEYVVDEGKLQVAQQVAFGDAAQPPLPGV